MMIILGIFTNITKIFGKSLDLYNNIIIRKGNMWNISF